MNKWPEVGSKKECSYCCAVPSTSLYNFIVQLTGKRLENHWLCKKCYAHLDVRGLWEITEIGEEYHYCNPLCAECMKNPREAVIF